jgi:cell fate regulator YaaT (PSP1 superfamily)
MINVVGVRFRTEGKVYYFDPGDLDIKRGDHIIVETARGLEFASVSFPKHGVTDDKVVLPLKPVIRVATPEDEAREAENREKEKDAIKICKDRIEKYGLEMKLVATEYTFDRNKLLFYFTADGRVDFRELVKDLASVFRTRIELRQIGVRDETKMKGGIGICGRCLCCSTYLSDFAPVSIRMAKDQNLSLNPTKISGACGRLMCCLKNEQETYEYLNKQLPKHGEVVTTIDNLQGTVQNVSVLRQTVKVMVELEGDEKELREYPVEELGFRGKKAVHACPHAESSVKKNEHHPDHAAKMGLELSSMDQEEAALAAAMDHAQEAEKKKSHEKRDSERRSEEHSHRSNRNKNRGRNNGNENRNENRNGSAENGHGTHNNGGNNHTNKPKFNKAEASDNQQNGEKRKDASEHQNRERSNNRNGNRNRHGQNGRNQNGYHEGGRNQANGAGHSNEQKSTERTPSRRREGWDNQLGLANVNSHSEENGQAAENKPRRHNNHNRNYRNNRNRRPGGNGQQKQNTEVKE